MMTLRHADAVLARSSPGRRLGALAATAMALALLGLGACSVDRRSDEYRCTDPSQCPSGMCDQGWCVPVAGPGDDAAGPVPSDAMGTPGPDDAAPGCPAVCTSCDEDTCNIECEAPDSCPTPVVCPAGWECDVACLGTRSCAAGVRCEDATSCAVRCQGSGTCTPGVTCGAGRCNVECRGPGACFAIDCGQSCACDTECGNGAICGRNCPEHDAECQEADGECDSTGCDVCEDSRARAQRQQ
jgi:hypothetical protein